MNKTRFSAGSLGVFMDHIPTFAIAIFLQPFALLFLAVFVFRPITRMVNRRMRDSKFKRLLLRRF